MLKVEGLEAESGFDLDSNSNKGITDITDIQIDSESKNYVYIFPSMLTSLKL